MKQIAKYLNGNTTVTIMNDGTKTREFYGQPSIMHPESIDVKITDYCDMGCSYCHESSTKKGVHGNVDLLLEHLKCLPAGVELAIGGGNPLSHPNLVHFLVALRNKGIIANITINQGHLKQYKQLIESLIEFELVRGIGISITSNNFKHVQSLLPLTSNIVYHVISGVNDVEIIQTLIDITPSCKILVLGYKVFGFGESYFSVDVAQNIKQWKVYLPKYLQKCTLSFDNLAIEQLNVRRLFTKEGWDTFYMGDDFTFTMYIDAVKETYAPTSRSRERVSFADTSLLHYFQKNKN